MKVLPNCRLIQFLVILYMFNEKNYVVVMRFNLCIIVYECLALIWLLFFCVYVNNFSMIICYNSSGRNRRCQQQATVDGYAWSLGQILPFPCNYFVISWVIFHLLANVENVDVIGVCWPTHAEHKVSNHTCNQQ